MANSARIGWYRVDQEEGKVVLDIFPFRPGGVTIYITAEEALELSELLKRAAKTAQESS